MQLPVDIPAVLRAATDLRGAAQTPVAVSVYIDDTASDDLIAHARTAFASAGANARVTIGYMGDAPVTPYEQDDMAVIVAGVAENVGEQAAHLRASGVPVMVVAERPDEVAAIARSAGAPISEHDIVSSGKKTLDERMGEWIISACAEKKLAFALAFRFVRRPLSVDAVNATALQNAGIGLVPLIPGADMPIMTLNQIKMLFQIATAYGEPMDMKRAKEVAAVVAGAFLFRNIARSAAGVVPVIGGVIRAGVGYAGTEAMGRAAIEYFEAGGDAMGFASVLQSAGNAATDTVKKAAATPLGQRALSRGKSLVKGALASSRKKS